MCEFRSKRCSGLRKPRLESDNNGLKMYVDLCSIIYEYTWIHKIGTSDKGCDVEQNVSDLADEGLRKSRTSAQVEVYQRDRRYGT